MEFFILWGIFFELLLKFDLNSFFSSTIYKRPLGYSSFMYILQNFCIFFTYRALDVVTQYHLSKLLYYICVYFATLPQHSNSVQVLAKTRTSVSSVDSGFQIRSIRWSQDYVQATPSWVHQMQLCAMSVAFQYMVPMDLQPLDVCAFSAALGEGDRTNVVSWSLVRLTSV